jgi:ABC-2 type transport system permease protein
VVICAVAVGLGWTPVLSVGSVVGALLTAALGTAAFAWLGLLVAGSLRAEATLAAANLVYLLLMAGGAVVFPSTTYGGFGHVLAFLPSGALGGGLRQSLLGQGFPGWHLVVLAGWAVAGTLLTSRTFKWE